MAVPKESYMTLIGGTDNGNSTIYTADDTATQNTMQRNIEKYLAGEKIEKAFDPSIGCSIKWKLQQT